MSVKPGTLENPERDLSVTNRESTVLSVLKRGAADMSVASDPASDLEALRQRIAEAKAATPTAPIPECVACYRRGWADALKSLE